MNLCIDQGNSSTKVGIFEHNVLIQNFKFENFDQTHLTSILDSYPVEACILSSVTNNSTLIQLLKQTIRTTVELSHTTRVPISNRYKTPETLGKDRLAAVVGATFLEPDKNLLIIDAGTAITYDFVDAQGVYHGGNIAPGIDLRLRALHEFTNKLPLVNIQPNAPLLGNDTISAIQSGVLQGVIFEIEGYINILKDKYSQLSTFLTGGSAFYFDRKLKSVIFAENNLVLIGLNRILQYNVQK